MRGPFGTSGCGSTPCARRRDGSVDGRDLAPGPAPYGAGPGAFLVDRTTVRGGPDLVPPLLVGRHDRRRAVPTLSSGRTRADVRAVRCFGRCDRSAQRVSGPARGYA